MSGKALLILVIGFTMIFLVMGYLWESTATRSVENHVSYYKNTVARNIAVSGANIALSEVMRDSTWTSDITGRDFENGKMTVTITPLDTLRELISTGTFMGTEQRVRVKLQRGERIFAEYAWFIPSVSTGSANRPWITGDSVWGGFHTNQFLVVDGDPVFFGKVTSLKGIQDQAKKPYISDPEFLGGYQSGIKVSWDSEMTFPDYAYQAEQGQLAGGKCYYNSGPGTNLWLSFNANGTVTYRTGPTTPGAKADDSSKYGPAETLPLSEFAPTGVVYLNKGNIFVSGTFNGELTIVAEGSAGGDLQSGQGNVGLVGDLVYETDPMIPNGSGGYMANPDCDDLLGIIATNNFVISTRTESGGYQNNVADPDVRIDAGIFCVKGGFNVENLNTLPGPTGSIYLQGSMTAGMEEMVAQFSGNTITKGYNRHVIFDSRFAVTPPTWYTYVTYYKIISWLE